jgi:hypothetical protein
MGDFVKQFMMRFISEKRGYSWYLLLQEWMDEHLQWKPSDYDGLDTLHVDSYDIWVPEISQFASWVTHLSFDFWTP